MSYFLLSGSKANMAGSTTALIKKKDRQHFVDAAALLRQTNAIAKDANDRIETARHEAVQQGFMEGATAAEADYLQALRELAAAVIRIEEHYAGQVAQAAYAAVVAIIGDLDDDERTARLVAQVLAKQKDRNGLSVHVATELQPKLAALFVESADVPVIANASLSPAECHVTTANGRIIASLPVQLAALRQRWGLHNEGAEH